jgi:hypothetical protein
MTTEFSNNLAGRILTWVITEPRRGPIQRAELSEIIQSTIDADGKAKSALKDLVALFDDEGKLNEQYPLTASK